MRDDHLMVSNLLAEVSEWTWHFLRDAPFRPREETITELLLTDLTRRGRGSVRVHKASVGEEAESGLDWAWAIETSAGWLHAVVQAKQVTGTAIGRYEELRKSSAQEQARRLIVAGRNFDAVPMFAFYNGEVPPFGGEGSVVNFGACGRFTLKRQGAGAGLAWDAGSSPMAVTLAHAEDVQDAILVPPYKNQRAERVNQFSLPWECLLCPKSVNASTGRPKIWRVAQEIRARSREEVADQRDAGEPWLNDRAPAWAGILLEGGTLPTWKMLRPPDTL